MPLRTPSYVSRSLPIPKCRVECEMHSPVHLHKGVTYTVHEILTFIMRLLSFCLQSLHHRFVDWTKPSTTALLLGTLTDLSRSKSELVAENARLRKPLIILRRYITRPACTKTDRILLVLLARMVRVWKQALFIIQEDDVTAVASPGFSALREVHIQSSCSHIKDNRRDRGLEEAKWPETTDYGEQSGYGHHAECYVLKIRELTRQRCKGNLPFFTGPFKSQIELKTSEY